MLSKLFDLRNYQFFLRKFRLQKYHTTILNWDFLFSHTLEPLSQLFEEKLSSLSKKTRKILTNLVECSFSFIEPRHGNKPIKIQAYFSNLNLRLLFAGKFLRSSFLNLEVIRMKLWSMFLTKYLGSSNVTHLLRRFWNFNVCFLKVWVIFLSLKAKL